MALMAAFEDLININVGWPILALIYSLHFFHSVINYKFWKEKTDVFDSESKTIRTIVIIVGLLWLCLSFVQVLCLHSWLANNFIRVLMCGQYWWLSGIRYVRVEWRIGWLGCFGVRILCILESEFSIEVAGRVSSFGCSSISFCTQTAARYLIIIKIYFLYWYILNY